ncbi:MAG: HAD domain-containing protein [Proteobacteria bacterium]|nr:HAD domain-containing protein [Pseudomonadota bacterium]
MSVATIFVDIDGVFHDVRNRTVEVLPGSGRLRIHGDGLFCWAPILWRLIEPYPVELVVHSSWRRHYAAHEILERFPREMRPRIRGVTDPGLRRHPSILAYVAQQDIQHFVVLDDTPGSFPDHWPPLIRCHENRGISEQRVQQGIQRFLDALPATTFS